MERKSTDARRAEISQALLRVMAEHGYVKATISKIAEEADVTPGLIHYHFANKQAILARPARAARRPATSGAR